MPTNDATPRISLGSGELPEGGRQAPKAPSIQSFFLKKAPQAEQVQDAGGVPRPGVKAKASGANRKQGQEGRQTKLSFGSTVRQGRRAMDPYQGHLVMIMKKMAAEWTSLQKQLPAP